jgi:hypothetical protein
MMVCPFNDEFQLLVLQVDHSRVAGLLAEHWGNDEFAELEPYASMVLAAQEHDAGWWEWEIHPTLNSDGSPVDYIGSTKTLGRVWLDFYRHGIERVAEHDPYAGLIISMHGEGLLSRGLGLLPHMPDLSGNPEVKLFIEEQHPFRSSMLEDLRSKGHARAADEHVWTSFKYMEVFDQLAQFICNRYPFNSTARKQPDNTLSGVPVPVREGVPDTHLTVDVQNESRAVVRPYPFDLDPLEIAFPARLIPNRTFTESEFLREFHRGRPITVTYSLHSS